MTPKVFSFRNLKIFLLDVRQPTGSASYTVGHIAGAINIPYQNVTAAIAAGAIPKNKIIVTICYTGMTGAQVMTVLRLLGYTSFNLTNGMSGWNNSTRVGPTAASPGTENFPIVSGMAPGSWTVFNP